MSLLFLTKRNEEEHTRTRNTFRNVLWTSALWTLAWIKRSGWAIMLFYYYYFFYLRTLHTTKTYSQGKKMHRRSSFENKTITKKQIIQNQENCNNPVRFAHFCYTINTQWSQNEMTSFTIFMAFLFAFLHNIQPFFNFSSFFFNSRERKKSICTISHYYFSPSKYRVVSYFEIHLQFNSITIFLFD